MKKETASRTAEMSAVIRAVESLRPEHERVCFDPYAKYFLDFKYSLIH